jgi:hypothetical protein
MGQKILVNIKEDGSVEVTTRGFKGKACVNASQFIEESLGTITSTKKTSEYYAEDVNERVKVNRG